MFFVMMKVNFFRRKFSLDFWYSIANKLVQLNYRTYEVWKNFPCIIRTA